MAKGAKVFELATTTVKLLRITRFSLLYSFTYPYPPRIIPLYLYDVSLLKQRDVSVGYTF